MNTNLSYQTQNELLSPSALPSHQSGGIGGGEPTVTGSVDVEEGVIEYDYIT